MNPLSLLPSSWLWPGAAFVGAVLIGIAGVQTVRLAGAQRDLATQAEGFSEQRLLASRAAAAEDARDRAEEQRRTTAQQEKIDEATKVAAQARADAVLADAAAGRLQQRIAGLVATAREAARNPAPVGPSPAASDPAGMLADVLGRCVARVRLLASVADERGTAGKLCEQSYDALTPPADQPPDP